MEIILCKVKAIKALTWKSYDRKPFSFKYYKALFKSQGNSYKIRYVHYSFTHMQISIYSRTKV